MKLLFDQNLSPRLVEALVDLFPGSAHVAALELDRADDREVARFAFANGFAVVTKDADFGDLSLVIADFPRVIWVQRGNCSTREIERLLREHAEAVRALESDAEASVLLIR